MIRKIKLATVSKSACLAAMLLAGAVFATTANAVDVTGPYFGQTPPGTTPTIFAPGILSLSNRIEGGVVFSPDGNECFFSAGYSWPIQMYYTKRVNNVWTTQALASSLLPGYSFGHPFFSAAGNKLYFTNNNDIWAVDRTSQGWGNPQVLPSPINSAYVDDSYSQTTDETAYFYSTRPGSGTGNIWRTLPQQPGQPLQAEILGSLNNSSFNNHDPVVSPDGRYLLFASTRSGHGRIFVSFANGNGGWNAPIDMNNYVPDININTNMDEITPTISPDGRYLFFARVNPNTQQSDVYWVSNPLYVPEPATVIQLGVAAMLLGLAGIRRFHRRV
jgi:Tol biopolymer transport system component